MVALITLCPWCAAPTELALMGGWSAGASTQFTVKSSVHRKSAQKRELPQPSVVENYWPLSYLSIWPAVRTSVRARCLQTVTSMSLLGGTHIGSRDSVFPPYSPTTLCPCPHDTQAMPAFAWCWQPQSLVMTLRCGGSAEAPWH